MTRYYVRDRKDKVQMMIPYIITYLKEMKSEEINLHSSLFFFYFVGRRSLMVPRIIIRQEFLM